LDARENLEQTHNDIKKVMNELTNLKEQFNLLCQHNLQQE
jgi:archaellum component FlaC